MSTRQRAQLPLGFGASQFCAKLAGDKVTKIATPAANYTIFSRIA
jgi:hypothetical protein